MTYTEKIIVLGVKFWKIEQENKEGVTINYIINSPSNEMNEKGFTPVKKSVSIDMASPLFASPSFPVLAEAEFSAKATAKGMVLELLSISPMMGITLDFGD